MLNYFSEFLKKNGLLVRDIIRFEKDGKTIYVRILSDGRLREVGPFDESLLVMRFANTQTFYDVSILSKVEDYCIIRRNIRWKEVKGSES